MGGGRWGLGLQGWGLGMDSPAARERSRRGGVCGRLMLTCWWAKATEHPRLLTLCISYLCISYLYRDLSLCTFVGRNDQIRSHILRRVFEAGRSSDVEPHQHQLLPPKA